MADELIRLDTTIIGIDRLIAKASTAEEAEVLFTAKDAIYNQQMYSIHAQPVNQWISCKDKMPEDGVNVLIYTGNRMISLAWYDKDMGYFYICDSDYKYNSLDVTHWQTLPEPPKED